MKNKIRVVVGSCLAASCFFLSLHADDAAPSNNRYAINYAKQLKTQNFASDPMQQYVAWKAIADQANLYHSEAVVLATSRGNDVVTARSVGIREVTQKGFVFYTDGSSPKMMQMKNKNNVVAVAVWHYPDQQMSQQVRIEGTAAPTGQPEEATYQLNGQPYKSYTQQMMITPQKVQFSQLTMQPNGVGLVEYIEYTKVGDKWEKKETPPYLSTKGC